MALLALSESLTVGTPSALVSLQTRLMGSKVVFAAGVAVAEVVGEQRAPAGGEADAAVEVVVQGDDVVDVEAVGGDEALAAGILAALQQPGDVLVAGDEGVFGVDALAGPVGDPVGCALEELGGAEGVGQRDEEFAAVALLPEFEDAILRRAELFVCAGEAIAASAMGSSWALVPMASRSCL